MPPKNQEPKQNKKDKKTAQPPTRVVAKRPSTQRGKPRAVPNYLVEGLKRSNVSFNALNALAQSICAPRDTLPMRLPDVVRKRTDVRHLWTMSSIKPVTDFANLGFPLAVGTLTVTDYSPAIGSSPLAPSTNMVWTHRNPVAPLFFAVSATSYCADAGTGATGWYDWVLVGRDNSTLGTYNIYPSPVLVRASPAAPIQVTPPADLAMLAPSQSYWDATTVDSPPGGVTTEPGYVTATGDYYSFYGGGRFIIELEHMNAAATSTLVLPAGAGVTFTCALCRYNGTTDDDEVLTITVAINTGAATGKGQSYVVLPVGFYRISVQSIVYQAPTADYAYGPVRLRVRKATGPYYPGMVSTQSGFTSRYFVVNPPNVALTNAPFVVENSRVNAMGTLLTNVTPSLSLGGDVFGARISEGEDFFEYNPSTLLSITGQVRTSYRGDLARGAYTWMELPDSYATFRHHTVKPGGANGPNMPPGSAYSLTISIDGTGPVHAMCVIAPMSNGISSTDLATSLQLRCDYHVEFISSSQLANNAISSLPSDTLTNATMALANASLFTENWIHLDQLWKAIKQSGSTILRAGGTAMASTAMRELIAGVAGLGLAL